MQPPIKQWFQPFTTISIFDKIDFRLVKYFEHIEFGFQKK